MGACEIVVLLATWTLEAQLKRIQVSTILAIGLDTMLVIFWKRICLLFDLALRICLRLN